MAYDFSDVGPQLADEFAAPCIWIPPTGAAPVSFDGDYWAPAADQQVTLSPMKALSVTTLTPTVRIYNNPALIKQVRQDDVIVVDPQGKTVLRGPLRYRVYGIRADGSGGVVLSLKSL